MEIKHIRKFYAGTSMTEINKTLEDMQLNLGCKIIDIQVLERGVVFIIYSSEEAIE